MLSLTWQTLYNTVFFSTANITGVNTWARLAQMKPSPYYFIAIFCKVAASAPLSSLKMHAYKTRSWSIWHNLHKRNFLKPHRVMFEHSSLKQDYLTK